MKRGIATKTLTALAAGLALSGAFYLFLRARYTDALLLLTDSVQMGGGMVFLAGMAAFLYNQGAFDVYSYNKKLLDRANPKKQKDAQGEAAPAPGNASAPEGYLQYRERAGKRPDPIPLLLAGGLLLLAGFAFPALFA